MKLKIYIFSVYLVTINACQDEPSPPDLESISRERCVIIEMCDPFNFSELWVDRAACEAFSAERFAAARASDRPCYDARVAWETCESMAEDCSEYEDDSCGDEYIEHFLKCEAP